jgi:hypothetical protein
MTTTVVELALHSKLPGAIEYADREATTRRLNLDFQNKSVRSILQAVIEQVPGDSVSFSGGIVDAFAARGRGLNKVIKDFAA